MTDNPQADRSLRAVLTVTVETRPDGGHYFDQADFTAHATEWVRAALKGQHAVDEVTVVDQAAELARAQAEAHQYRTALQGVARAAAAPFAPADRAAVRAEALNEAADFVRGLLLTRTLVTTTSLEAELRRMADEAQQAETQQPVRVETLARLLCDADNALTDGPSWDQISQTPGLGRDEYRNAARYLLRKLAVTQADNGPVECGDQIPGMRCTLPDGPHDDWMHRDEVGHWWSQMRVAPYTNRDRIAAEDAAVSQPAREV